MFKPSSSESIGATVTEAVQVTSLGAVVRATSAAHDTKTVFLARTGVVTHGGLLVFRKTGVARKILPPVLHETPSPRKIGAGSLMKDPQFN